MTTLTATDRSTVAKLLGLIGSHHDGEALAAARKARQLVTRTGSTWPEILGLEHVEPEPEVSISCACRGNSRPASPAVTG